MATPGYTIEVDTDHNLLTIHPTGLWDLALLAQHCDDFERAVDACGRPYRILADLRGFAIQPQAVSEGLQAFVAQQQSARTAMLLSGSVLQRMQSGRISAANAVIRAFGPEEEAVARRWLFEA